MAGIDISCNNKIFEVDQNGCYKIKVSASENNGIKYDENGKLIAVKGKDGIPGSEGISNYPGNAISGEPNKTIPIVKCNQTVSRRQLGDPDPANEGPLMSTIVEKILENI